MIKNCEFCKGIIETKKKDKRFCNPICQRRAYNQLENVKEQNRLHTREYRRTHPEWKERHRILQLTRHREYRAEYWKEYGKREEVRARIRERQNLRRKFDRDFFVRARIRRSFGHALSRYSKTGKVASSEKYDMNWKEVIESLKPFPKNLKDFEVDHIIPLHVFDLDDPEQIKMAFSPSNLRWLRREENRKKSGRLVIIGKSEEGFLSIKDTEFENAPMC